MIEGVLIFICILLTICAFLSGHGVYRYYFPIKPQQVKKQYDKYKNPDGLYSSKAVRGDKEVK